MKHNCLFVILGATGDLAKKKLIPAIYKLVKDKKITDFAVVGLARDRVKSDTILNNSKKNIKKIDKKVWEQLRRRFYYFSVDFYDEERFCMLGTLVDNIEAKYKLSGERTFYLATLPQHFDVVTSTIKKCNLADKNSKLVFEKPFGEDLKSAQKINKVVKKVFREKQIFRIDHYLGKELVQNIAVVRFANPILRSIWNNENIDHVQIIVSENFGIEGRGAFYDKTGALKDVVQSHMLQMLSLTAMEEPKNLTGEFIRNQKVKVLKSIRTIKKEDVVLGQYESYKKEKKVGKDSKTETFAALKLFVDNKRWKNVPFYFITGKNMKDRFASIYVEFKKPPCHLLKGICEAPNYLIIQIQPNEGFYMQFNAKVPGKMQVSTINMDFCHECKFGPNSPEAYETLLFDVIRGDHSVFVRADEVEYQWKIIDKIKKPKVHAYKKGSYPEQAKKLILRDKRYWHLRVK